MVDEIVDLPAQVPRVGLISQVFKALAFLFRDCVGSAQTLEGSLGWAVVATHSAVLVAARGDCLVGQAHDRLEQVVIDPHLVVESVKR